MNMREAVSRALFKVKWPNADYDRWLAQADKDGQKGRNWINHHMTLVDVTIKNMLPFIKEAMEYHGVQGAMNKMIIKRLEEQCK